MVCAAISRLGGAQKLSPLFFLSLLHPQRVRRLNHSHLAAAAVLATTVQVILTPYGQATKSINIKRDYPRARA